MAAKKILFIIVEGPSDEASLGLVLSRLYQPLPVHIEIVHGDITTEKGTTTVNIISKVAEIIKGYARNNHVTPKHFQQIVHIVDTDGVYIDDKYIMEDLQVKDTVYSTEEIYTSSVSRIANRNKQKRANLNKLSATSKIWNIPYQVFYMSCNLEHVLHNKCNNTDCEKKENAHHFTKYYKDKLDDFVSFICQSDFSVLGDYKESWDFIKKEKHSLQRHSNFGIFLQQKQNCL